MLKVIINQSDDHLVIHHNVTKVIVCTLTVNQNTFKTTAKEKFTNNVIYSNGLSSSLSESKGL